jgi:serine/threonine-protein kinase
VLETLEQVRTREPVRPLDLQPSVPRDLETICLKCLQKDPARRYQSAGALADDLDRFLNGEPIRARPGSRAERVWRWCKRNPRIAGLSAAVVLLVVVWAVTSSLLAWNLKLQTDEAVKNEKEAIKQTRIAQKQTHIAKEQTGIAQKQTLIAERNELSAKATATGAIHHMVRLGELVYARLQSKQLAVVAGPQVAGLRREVLAVLRESLKKVSASIDAAGGTPYGEVGTHQAMGDLLAKLGQGEEAQRSYKRGYELMQQIAKAKPNSDVARGNLYLMLQRLGNVPLERGDPRTALSFYRQARDQHWDIFVHPGDRFYPEREIKRVVSNDDIHVGKACLALGKSAAAKEFFQESLNFRQAWLKEQSRAPNITSGRSLMMEAYFYLGIACSNLGDGKGVEANFNEAIKIGEDLQLSETIAKKNPLSAAEFRDDLARAYGAYGDALLRLGKATEADKAYRESWKNFERAIALDDQARLELLAQTHERLAAVAKHLTKKKADADTHYLEAFKLRKELYHMQENNPTFQAAFVLAGARTGKIIPADHFASKFRLGMGKSPPLLLQLARCWSICAATDLPQKAEYLKRALEALQTATKDDYQDVVVLQTDPELEPLRPLPTFQAVIREVKSR